MNDQVIQLRRGERISVDEFSPKLMDQLNKTLNGIVAEDAAELAGTLADLDFIAKCGVTGVIKLRTIGAWRIRRSIPTACEAVAVAWLICLHCRAAVLVCQEHRGRLERSSLVGCPVCETEGKPADQFEFLLLSGA